jgi:hypothetical protein
MLALGLQEPRTRTLRLELLDRVGADRVYWGIGDQALLRLGDRGHQALLLGDLAA